MIVLHKLHATVLTDQGKVRTNNEDNFYFDGKGYEEPQAFCHFSEKCSTRKKPIFAVFDGLGGESYGEIASSLAVQTLRQHEKAIKHCKSEQLDAVVQEFVADANQNIYQMAKKLQGGNSGTTMAMLCFQGDQVYPFYIGDSRIYLYNGTDLYRLTSDHTLANHKLQTGIYTKEEAELSSDRNKLIQFLGADLQHFTLPHAAQPPLRIYRGYRFLLCSDGLTDMCDDQTIYRVLSSGQPDMANELMQLAMDAGGVDNTTLILIEVL